MVKNNYFILTGAMGAGKTTVINILKEKYKCVDEPARVILKEQRTAGGTGVPEKDAGLFNLLMLERMISQYKNNLRDNNVVIYDRGIADIAAYSKLLNTEMESSLKAAKELRYNKSIFMFRGWEEIYTTDDERTVDFKTADTFGSILEKIYTELDYNIIDVPFVSADERAEFIEFSINKMMKVYYK